MVLTRMWRPGAGSWGEPNDSCGTKGALYSGGGNPFLSLSDIVSLLGPTLIDVIAVTVGLLAVGRHT